VEIIRVTSDGEIDKALEKLKALIEPEMYVTLSLG